MDLLDVVREVTLIGTSATSGWYLNRRSTKNDRKEDKDRATQQDAELEWIDRHRSFREDAQHLLRDIGVVVTAACEEYQKQRDLEDLKLPELILKLANLVRKTRDWHFTVLDLPELLEQLRRLWDTIDIYSMVAQTTNYVHAQCAAAFTAQALLQGASDEVDRQWAKPRPSITESSTLKRRNVWRIRKKNGSSG